MRRLSNSVAMLFGVLGFAAAGTLALADTRNVIADSLTCSNSSFAGQILGTLNPATTAFTDGSLIANPAACGANEILIGAGVGNTAKATMDCEGDLVAVKGNFSGVLTASSTSTLTGAVAFGADNTYQVGDITAPDIANITRSVPLPLNSWFDGTSRAMLSVDDGADAQPDITLVSSVPRILYDVTGGSPDTNEICTSFTVPADYASGGTIVGRIKQAAATVTQVETFSCRASVDDGAISVANAANLTNVTSVQTATSTPAITWAAGSTISVCCKQGNASADDAVAILSIEGQYTATE